MNLAAAALLARANRTSLNVEGAYRHILTDLYGFIATVIAALVILATDYTRADPIASLVVVALMVLRPGPVPVSSLPGRGCRLSRGQAQGRQGSPAKPRTVETDGHIGRGWFRTNVWLRAIASADLGFHVSPHGLHHAQASWLIADGADLQVVKERLGHASTTTPEKYLHTLPDVADQSVLDALAAVRPTTPPAVLAEPAPPAIATESSPNSAKPSPSSVRSSNPSPNPETVATHAPRRPRDG